MLINFSFNKVYTFPKGSRPIHQEGRTFVGVAFIGLLLMNLFALLFVYISEKIFVIPKPDTLIKTYSHILAVGLVGFYSFLGHKYFTYRSGIRRLFL